MADKPESRFDAEHVQRLAATCDTRRVEMQFTDSDEREHIVTLPVEAAVALGRLICDLSEGTPFLQNGAPAGKKKRNP